MPSAGRLKVSDGADIPIFLLSDGKLGAPVALSETVTLSQSVARYEASLPPGSLEDSTRYTIRIRAGHLKKVRGATLDAGRAARAADRPIPRCAWGS